MFESMAIGVDIGGSHITSAIVDLHAQRILLPTLRRAFVNARGGVDEIISAWCNVIADSCKQPLPEPVKIGIAMPGPFDYEQGIAFMQEQNKYDSLYGLNIKSILAERLTVAPENISFLNDAACFLKGEVFGGAAKGYSKVLGLTLGTGFGSAISRDGVVNDAGLWCDPYQDGIAEDLFSTRWFVKRYFQLTGNHANDVKEMLGDSGNNDAVQQVFREFGENLGAYLVSIKGRFEYDMVVIGGNIAKSFTLFSEQLQQVFNRHNLPVSIKCTELNENAALVGAASVWKKGHKTSRTLHYQEQG
jgi:glucokinase